MSPMGWRLPCITFIGGFGEKNWSLVFITFYKFLYHERRTRVRGVGTPGMHTTEPEKVSRDKNSKAMGRKY